MKIRPYIVLAALLLASSAFAASASGAEKSKIENPKSKITSPRPYPLEVCLVTDNDLGSMGEETSIVYEGQVIKFCCAPCEKKFRANPAKYLAKLAASVNPETPAPEKK